MKKGNPRQRKMSENQSEKKSKLLAAVRTSKNKELVQALGLAKEDVRQLFQENLTLKRERQQLLEQVASLETRLSTLLTVHSTQQSLAKVLQDIEKNITQARSLISPLSSPPLPSLPQDMETDQVLPTTLHCGTSLYTVSPSLGEHSDNNEKGEDTFTEDITFTRPKRACTSTVQSYSRTPLRGVMEYSNNSKSFKNVTKRKSSHVKAGLRDITNKMN